MTHRKGCGTHLGLLLHLELGETPCATCRHGEQLRTLELERIAPPPTRQPWIYADGPTARHAELQRQRDLWTTPETAVAASTRAFGLLSPPSTVTTRTSQSPASGSCAATATPTDDDDTRRTA